MNVKNPILPIMLTNLFEDTGFIASTSGKFKPCIKGKYHVSSGSWSGWLWRRWDGETCEKTRLYIRNLCERIVQAKTHYAGTHFEPIIIDKMVALRRGIINIVRGYEDNEITVNSLNDSLMILCFHIPENIKVKYGFSDVIPAEMKTSIDQGIKSSPRDIAPVTPRVILSRSHPKLRINRKSPRSTSRSVNHRPSDIAIKEPQEPCRLLVESFISSEDLEKVEDSIIPQVEEMKIKIL